MKRIFLISLLVIISIYLKAQDIIIRTNGDRVLCKVTKIDKDNVYFDILKNDSEIHSYIDANLVKDIKYNVGDEIKIVQDSIKNTGSYTNSVTIGIFNGGGLVGIDYEKLFFNSVGLQAGAGISGFGAGVNIHFKPTIRSSFISMQYCHQGIGENYYQSLVGPNYVFRGKKWFTFQIGFGFQVEKGPANHVDPDKQSEVMLTAAIGAYIPW